MDAIAAAWRRFCGFLGDRGQSWESATKMDLVRYMGHLFRTTSIQGETAEQYVSAVNRAYDLLGFPAPGRPLGSKSLYFEVQSALTGFVQRRLNEQNISASCTPATPDTFILELCRVALTALRSENLSIARAALANIFQYYMIWRPTMAAAVGWSNLKVVSNSEIEVLMPRDMTGRKDKKGREKVITRRISGGICHPELHPIALIFEYRRQVDVVTRRRRLLPPLGVWQLPTEGFKTFGSTEMNAWLKSAATNVPAGLPPKITPRCHRNGASTLAYRLLKDYPDFCWVADWELTGETFKKTYYRPSLEVDMELARFFFADLAR